MACELEVSFSGRRRARLTVIVEQEEREIRLDDLPLIPIAFWVGTSWCSIMRRERYSHPEPDEQAGSEDEHDVSLPPALEPGRYRLFRGL